MNVHHLPLLLLLLPCVCSAAANGSASIVGHLVTSNMDNCVLSNCEKNFNLSCNKLVFWDKKSICIFLNCPSEKSCEQLLEELATKSQDVVKLLHEPRSLPTSFSQSDPDVPQPGIDAQTTAPNFHPKAVVGPSSAPSTSLPVVHPVDSSNTNSSSKNEPGGPGNPPQVNTVVPSIKNITAPAATLRPETTPSAPPKAVGSENFPTAGAKTSPEIETTPEIKTTSGSSPKVPSTAPTATNATVITTTTVSTSTTVTNATTFTVAAITNTTVTTSTPSTIPVTTTVSTATNTTTVPLTVPVQPPTTAESTTMIKITTSSPSSATTTTPPPHLPSTHSVTPTEDQKPSETTRNPPEKPPTGQLPNTDSKARDQAGQGVLEAAGEPLTFHVVNTSSLLAVLMFGLLFFVVTVVLFLRHAYESYKRKDYTQVDYLINGMYSDSGV
ncbi:uncharacterized protein C11orf24 homolog isoform X4 [Astyanax mexicanus]|uniref:uncharacterized protein C11orf24 homolog isoform X4 n=1 Tax=Astyanax mexicanus TaxID=7994 RepID=UPI0020CAD402|nr:uncharacterized protein C11orf24 homolog isoform X4 [Astyanax mexicanus]